MARQPCADHPQRQRQPVTQVGQGTSVLGFGGDAAVRAHLGQQCDTVVRRQGTQFDVHRAVDQQAFQCAVPGDQHHAARRVRQQCRDLGVLCDIVEDHQQPRIRGHRAEQIDPAGEVRRNPLVGHAESAQHARRDITDRRATPVPQRTEIGVQHAVGKQPTDPRHRGTQQRRLPHAGHPVQRDHHRSPIAGALGQVRQSTQRGRAINEPVRRRWRLPWHGRRR